MRRSLGLRSLAPASWLRLPRRTARLRLTLLYAGMFLVLGTAVIAVTYALARGGSTVEVSQATPKGSVFVTPAPAPPAPGIVPSGIDKIASQQRATDLSRLLEVSWLVLAVTAVASALFGWFAAGRVLRPLRHMTSTARTISAGNLGERLALTGPDDEFKRLGDTLDDLLSRLQASFEAQRRFVSNASHELRTPLTYERTALQVALADQGASAQTLRATCEELLSSNRDQERLLEALLTLASSERGVDRHEPLDLAELSRRAARAPRPEIERKSLALDTALAPAATVGDPALVERLIGNLIDNAVSYNQEAGRVEIRTATDAGLPSVSVTNTGPVVAADQVGRLFEPFQRLENGRTARADGHHGLGLSIVRAIATAHGATIRTQPQPEGGLRVTVTFAPPPEARQPA